jgi:hypothetical protein
MSTLIWGNRPIIGPLHLLRRNENGLTFALGYAFSEIPRLLEEFHKFSQVPKRSLGSKITITLQERYQN